MPERKNPIIFKSSRDLKKKLSDLFTDRSPHRENINIVLNRHLKSTLLGPIGLRPDSKLGKKIESLDSIDILKYKDKTVKIFTREVVKPTLGRDRALLAEYEEFERALPSNKTVDSYLDLDKSIDKHPAFGNVVRNTNAFLLLKESIIKNDENKVNKVLNALTTPGPKADPQLKYMVKDNIVTTNELTDIKFTLDLGTITLNNNPLIACLKADGIDKLESLIEFSEEDWVDYLKAHSIEIPEIFKGAEKDIAYSRHLEEVFTSVFPTKKLFSSLISLNEDDINNDLKIVEKFLKDNLKIKIETCIPKRDVNWGGADRATRSKIRRHFNKLRKFGRSYNHLGINDVLNARNKTMAQKINEIKTLVAKLDKFIINNPEFDFQSADFHPSREYIKNVTDKKDANKLKINWSGLNSKEKSLLIPQLKRYQRLYRIHPRYQVIDAMLGEGISSARQITTMSEANFVKKYHKKLGKDEKFAKEIYRIAQERVNQVSLLWANAKDTTGSRIYNPNPGPGLYNNLGEDVVDYIKKIEGYQEIFGEIRFCECPECRSIFSPAAYFVDLMRFINKEIPTNTLNHRRGDLEKIELSCENTKTLVPYIELVNEVLESKLGVTETDRDKPYEDLLAAKYPFTMPFNLHLERIRVFIEHFESTLSEIYNLFSIDKTSDANEQKHIAIEALGISPEELDVLTAQLSGDVNGLKVCYGIGTSANLVGTLTDVKTFLKHTKLSHTDLNELIGTELKEETEKKDLFISQDGNNRYITIRKNDTDNTEELKAVLTITDPNPQDLSHKQIDRLHRFIRLSKRLNWSFEDLDWVLKSIGANEIDETAIISMAKIKELREKFEVPLDVLCGFWSEMKSIGHRLTEEPKDWPLFERVFKDQDEQTAAYDFTSQTEEWDYINPAGHIKLGLLATLEIYENDLLMLFEKLKTVLDPTNQDKVTLTKQKLSLLYRFGKLTKVLKISIREFFMLWELLGKQNTISIDDVEEITKIIEWINESDWSIYELHFVLTGTENEFTDPGFHDEDLRIFLIEQKTDPAQFDKFTTAAEIKAEKKNIVSEKLSLFFTITPQLFSGLADIASINLDDDNLLDEVVTELKESDPVPPTILTELKKFHRYKYIITKIRLTEIEITALKAKPSQFGVGSVNPLDVNTNPLKVEGIKNLDRLKVLKETYGDALNQFVEYLNIDVNQRDKKAERLSSITLWPQDDIKDIYEHFWSTSGGSNPSYDGIPNIWRMKKCLDLSKRTGVTVKSIISQFNLLITTSSRNLVTYQTPADSLLEIVKAKYDEYKWEEIYNPLKNHISELKKDALAAYLAGADNLRALYGLLLMDTEMSSCFEISRIKFAISSLQLYFQRCQMNLEKGTDGDDIFIRPELQKEWAWRKTYRVWEANRKVFLYPENYIYPELRDNKSPQFKELEDELLQGEITEANVERAYKNYLDKFVVLANLRIAGAYFDDNTNTMYLIGRTKTEPHVFYYRQYENNHTWTPWEKIDLTINAEYISPVFAFQRLFIFWVETQTEKGVNEGDDLAGSSFSEEITKATVKYSFYDFDNRWIQPQVLDQDLKVRWSDLHPPFPEEVDPYNNRIRLSNRRIYDIDAATLFLKYLYANLVSSGEGGDLDLMGEVIGEWMVLRYDSHKILFVRNTAYKTDAPNFWRYNFSQNAHSGELESVAVLNAVASGSKTKTVINDKNRFLIDTMKGEYLAQLKHHYSYFRDDHRVSIEVFGGSVHPLWGEVTELAVEQEQHRLLYYNYTSVSFQRIDTQAANNLGPILFSSGIDGLLNTATQYRIEEPDFAGLDLNYNRILEYPETTQVDFEGSYGLYYRELFFHVPFLIANRLNADQKFEEAQKWYHYIFNPTHPVPEDPNENDLDGEPLNNQNNRYWQYLPFRKSDLDTLKEILTNEDAIDAYRTDPFDPHAIARTRINAYQKSIVMKYIDNLIDWADYLFAQDSIEAVNEATNLYILAYDLLGEKPAKLGECPLHEPLTYTQIEDQIQGGIIPEFFVDLENSYLVEGTDIGGDTEGAAVNEEAITPYFCTPENDLFLKYWDRVEDRLYKIRHCMNIKGIVRQLPLFQPPIDPMALVRAVASGMDISSVISEITAGMVSTPHYRFTYMIEKAKNLVSSTQQLGSALLSALEKKDAEELSQMRSLHEKNILSLTSGLKENQKKEADENIKALEISKQSAVDRNVHYKNLIKKGLISEEKLQLASMLLASFFDQVSNTLSMAASIGYAIPNAGSPFAMTYGGREIGAIITALSQGFRSISSMYTLASSMSSVIGSFARREQDWVLQGKLSAHDVEQIEFQRIAAELRKEIIEQEIVIQEKNMEQNDEIIRFLKDKFTNKDLYQWISNQLSGLYFKTYKMAYDLAKTAERTYQYETGADDVYINYGHWDSLKKGLLAGERLSLELNQMEVAYINQNSRDTFDIEKTISLRFLDPKALYDLKTKGECQFEFTEKLFDLDFPGHYFRKIKNVSISIPAIVGPYENVKATLTQMNNRIMKRPDIEGIKYMFKVTGNPITGQNGDNTDVIEDFKATRQIAVSRGVNDTGMFELNFRDERYLPFEGTGAVSSWKLEMPKASNQIDFKSISDVIVNLQYTAKFDGGLKTNVVGLSEMKKAGGYRIISLEHEFSTEWHGFINPQTESKKHVMDFNISEKMFLPNTTEIVIKEIFVKLDLDKTLYNPDNTVNLDTDLSVKLKVKKDTDSNLTFKFSNSDTAEKNVDYNIKDIIGFELSVDRKKTDDPEKDIPEKLRQKNEDDTYRLESINGNDYYFLDPDKLRNIGLVLIFDASLTW